MERIPVVYATSSDIKYMRLTAIAAISVIFNSTGDYGIDFFFLINEDCPEENKIEIKRELLNMTDNCTVNFIYEGIEKEDTYTIDEEFITKETCYRLFLPDILKNVKKCIYLDSDTIVCSDIRSLYEKIFDNKYITGVKAPGFHVGADPAYAKQAMIPDMSHYVNAGVLGMNLELMREDGVLEKIRKLLKIKMECGDQDCLNSACYEKIGFFDYKYNVMTKYAQWGIHDYKGIFKDTEIIDAWNDPKIIHYADRVKPWNDVSCPFAKRWWNVCKKTNFFEYFMDEARETFFKEAVLQNRKSGKNLLTSSFFSPCVKEDYSRRYAVYGAGKRAEKVIKWLKSVGLAPEYVLVTDLNDNPENLEGISVKTMNEVGEKEKDITLIIATMESRQADILRGIQKVFFKDIILLNDEWDYKG